MDNYEFRREFIRNYECPECGHRVVLCEFGGCLNEAAYEAWFGHGLIRKMKACEKHIVQSRGWKKQEKEYATPK